MSIQSFAPPADITWTRMAYSRDMIDSNFGDRTFGPKWRSSLAVYYYVMPDEETVDDYPNSRIVYLKLTCSITGYNPSEELADARKVAEESGALDDLQRSAWEVITSSSWAAKYWACVGAIMQLAIYPPAGSNLGPDEYPYILDFEPKKREMFESVAEGSEILSGSGETTEVTKGNTNVTGTELTASASASYGFGSASASAKRTSTDTTVNQNTTDTSRERRETLSRTTQSSQMYQLFNGYHLGSNRALFVVTPRPHTAADQAQTGFNLLDGKRKLEGIQEVFLVVHMPRSLTGLCVQAGLDTGHEVEAAVAYQALMGRRVDDGGPARPGTGRPPPPVPPPNPPSPPPSTPVTQIVITRRVVQGCGLFDDNGNLVLQRLAEPVKRPPLIHGEIAIADEETRLAYARLAKDPTPGNRSRVADALNHVQRQVRRLMLDRVTAVGYKPRDLPETETFKSLVANAAREDPTSIADLVHAGHLTSAEAQLLKGRKVNRVSELFDIDMSESNSRATSDIRRKVINRLTTVRTGPD